MQQQEQNSEHHSFTKIQVRIERSEKDVIHDLIFDFQLFTKETSIYNLANPCDNLLVTFSEDQTNTVANLKDIFWYIMHGSINTLIHKNMSPLGDAPTIPARQIIPDCVRKEHLIVQKGASTYIVDDSTLLTRYNIPDGLLRISLKNSLYHSFFAEHFTHKKALVFLMAQQPRCGQHSPAKKLPQFVMHDIIGLFFKETSQNADFLKEFSEEELSFFMHNFNTENISPQSLKIMHDLFSDCPLEKPLRELLVKRSICHFLANATVGETLKKCPENKNSRVCAIT